MILRCETCGRVYDDADRWTICPHPGLHEAQPRKEQRVMYSPTDEQRKRNEINFTYHQPHGNQGDRYGSVREKAFRYAEFLQENCPVSRELSLAMTKLEEAVFWANAAIARNEKP